MLTLFIAIFILSLFLAFRSMNDFEIPKEIRKLLTSNRLKGTIIFFRDKIKHYH